MVVKRLNITNKNHYNPCFWTAFWNSNYLNAKRQKRNQSLNPREIEIYSLNIKSNKILIQKTRNVFFEKGAGLAKITREDALSYCNRVFPEDFNSLHQYYNEHPEDLYIDFENHFTAFESFYRPSLEKVIQTKTISNIQDKTYVSIFILLQMLRNYQQFKNAILFLKERRMAKFELFLFIKHTISDSTKLMKLLLPLLSSKWQLITNQPEIFPLSDNPVINIREVYYLPIAPDLLLKIKSNEKVTVDQICTITNKLSKKEYRKFRNGTIYNAGREIISGDETILQKWQKTRKFKNKLSLNK